MIDHATYIAERAICDTAERYRQNLTQGKRNYLTAEEAAHPDYAACDNAMRGRVEQYELLTNPPASIFAYLSSDCRKVTVWTGDELAHVDLGRPYRSNMGDKRYPFRCTIGGKRYSGTGYGGGGMYARLRQMKAA